MPSTAAIIDPVSPEEAPAGGDVEVKTKVVRKRRPKAGLARGMVIPLYPTVAQDLLLRQWTGAGRWVWNHALNLQNEYYAQTGTTLPLKEVSQRITGLRQQPDLSWLGEVPRTCLTQQINHLGSAWNAHFESTSGERAGPRMGLPRFHARGSRHEALYLQIDTRHKSPVVINGQRLVMAEALPVPKDEPHTAEKEPPTQVDLSEQSDVVHNANVSLVPAVASEPEGGPEPSQAKQARAPRAENIPAQGDHLFLNGLGWVATIYSDIPPGRISKITVRKKAGQWRASLTLVDVPAERLIRRPEKTKQFADPLDPTGLVALDMSVRKGAVAHDGTQTYSLAEADLRKKLDRITRRRKRHQRSSSRKNVKRMQEMGLDPKKPIPKGTRIPVSNRHQADLDRASLADLKALFIRRDLVHKFTTDLVRNYHTIVVETLSLKGMAKGLSRGFRRRFHEAAMGEIISQLRYKSEWYGRKLIFVDRWFPSSKLCSTIGCDYKYKALKLSETAWVCPQCHTHHDRDENAAINLWLEGWKLVQESLHKCSTDHPTVRVGGKLRALSTNDGTGHRAHVRGAATSESLKCRGRPDGTAERGMR